MFKTGQRVRVRILEAGPYPWFATGDTGTVLSADKWGVVEVCFDRSPTVLPPGIWFAADIELETVNG